MSIAYRKSKMEETNMKAITIITLILSASLSFAQESIDVNRMIVEGKTDIEAAVAAWDLPKMITVRGYFERLLTLEQSPEIIHYHIAYADFRIVGFYFAGDDLEDSKKYINDGIEHLEFALDINDADAEAHILLSSLYGNKIAVKPILGMTLGIKSASHADKAVKLAPENPRVAFLSGTNAYYTPRMFGGGKEKALQYLNKAAGYFKTFHPASDLAPDWGLVDTYVYLGLVNLKLQNYSEAEKNLNLCLELAPNNGWALELKAQLPEKKNADQ